MEDIENIQINNLKKEKDLSKYYMCECGKLIFATNRSSHKKRPAHLKRMENKNNITKDDIITEVLETLNKLGFLNKN